ncbi:MAG: TonB-dependent receptor [Ignavibacteria bacterium]|nr:TonB-dependent receptor [Ignavibacteria bacterium]
MFKIMFPLVLFILATALLANEEASDTLKKFVLPSVTVTSTRAIRGETPIPFSELSYKQIEPIYTTQDIPRLLSELPSIITYSQSGNDIGYSNMTMRGFNQRRISVMINGVPQNDPEDHNVYWIDFPDFMPNVQQVQIQRGAGLNHYGSAAIGGSINFTTGYFLERRSVKLFTGIGFQEFGNGDPSEIKANVTKYSIEFSSGLVDKYAFYGRLSRTNSLGYRNHSYAFLNSYFFSAARFDDNFSTQVNIFGGPFTDGLDYTGVPKEFVKDLTKRRYNLGFWTYDSTGKNVLFSVERRKQEIEEFSQPHYEILNDWQISPDLRFLSILFYYTGDGFFDYDASWADTFMLRLTSEYGFSPSQNPTGTIFRGFVGNKHGGWIPRIVWKYGKNELTAGLEMRLHRSVRWGKIRFAEYLPTNFNPDYKVYSIDGFRDMFSGFVRNQYYILDELSVFAEAQLNYQRYAIKNEKAGGKYVYFTNIDGKRVGGENFLFDIKYLFFNPRIGFSYKLSPDWNLFGFVAYTSREPRMRNLYPAEDSYFGAKPQFEFKQVGNEIRYDFSKPLLKPESMLDIEFGSNFKISDNFNFNTNLYFMSYADELAKTGRIDIFGNPIEENIPRSHHYGLELEAIGTIVESDFGKLSFYGNATLSNNRIVDYDFFTYDSVKISFKDNPISGFPDFMGNIRLSYEYGGFFASLHGQYVGGYRTDNYGNLITENKDLIRHLVYRGDYYADNKVDPYFVVNLNANYSFRNIGYFQSLNFKLQVRNLFNQLYAAGAEGKEFFPAAERNYFLGIELEF